MIDLISASRIIANQVAGETSFDKASPEFMRIHYGAAQGFRLAVPLAIDAEADRIAKWLEGAAAEILMTGIGSQEYDLPVLEQGVAVIEFVADAIRKREHRNG